MKRARDSVQDHNTSKRSRISAPAVDSKDSRASCYSKDNEDIASSIVSTVSNELWQSLVTKLKSQLPTSVTKTDWRYEIIKEEDQPVCKIYAGGLSAQSCNWLVKLAVRQTKSFCFSKYGGKSSARCAAIAYIREHSDRVGKTRRIYLCTTEEKSDTKWRYAIVMENESPVCRVYAGYIFRMPHASYRASVDALHKRRPQHFSFVKCGGDRRAYEAAIAYVRSQSDQLECTRVWRFRSVVGLPIEEWEKQRSGGKMDTDGCFFMGSDNCPAASFDQSENRGVPGFLREEEELYFAPARISAAATETHRQKWEVKLCDPYALKFYVQDMAKYAVLKAPQAATILRFLQKEITGSELRQILFDLHHNYTSAPVDLYRDRICLPYLGGSFAGDGSVGVYYCKKSTRWAFKFALACCDCPRLLDHIREFLASISVKSEVCIVPRDGTKAPFLKSDGTICKDLATLSICCSSMLNFAQQLLPFSSDMRPQIEVFIAARQLFESTTAPRSDGVKAQLHKYVAEMKRLKKL